jgi:hypothetical protein
VKNRFQAFAFKCNLYRYTLVCTDTDNGEDDDDDGDGEPDDGGAVGRWRMVAAGAWGVTRQSAAGTAGSRAAVAAGGVDALLSVVGAVQLSNAVDPSRLKPAW